MLFPSDKNSLCFLLQVNYFFLWLFYWLYLVKVACFKSMIFSCSSIFFLKIVYSIISVTVSKSPFIILFSNSYFSLVRNTPRRASLLSVFNTEIEMVTNAFQYRACWLIYVMMFPVLPILWMVKLSCDSLLLCIGCWMICCVIHDKGFLYIFSVHMVWFNDGSSWVLLFFHHDPQAFNESNFLLFLEFSTSAGLYSLMLDCPTMLVILLITLFYPQGLFCGCVLGILIPLVAFLYLLMISTWLVIFLPNAHNFLN